MVVDGVGRELVITVTDASLFNLRPWLFWC